MEPTFAPRPNSLSNRFIPRTFFTSGKSLLLEGLGPERGGDKLYRQRISGFEIHGCNKRNELVAYQHVENHLHVFTFKVYRRILNHWQFERWCALKFDSHNLPLLPKQNGPAGGLRCQRCLMGRSSSPPRSLPGTWPCLLVGCCLPMVGYRFYGEIRKRNHVRLFATRAGSAAILATTILAAGTFLSYAHDRDYIKCGNRTDAGSSRVGAYRRQPQRKEIQ